MIHIKLFKYDAPTSPHKLDTAGRRLMSAQNQIVKARLERLVSSGICPAEDVTEYTDELRMLVHETINAKKVRLQSELLKALSSPLRLKILKLLNIREMCECEIMVAFDLTQPTASHHLEILEKAGLVKSRREGKWVFFKITNAKILNHIENLTSEANAHMKTP